MPRSPVDLAREFWDFFGCLRGCVVGCGVEIGELDLDNLYRPVGMRREMFRVGPYHVKLPDDTTSRDMMHYVRGCLGDRVEVEILKHPRLCALWAGTMVGGRWRRGEGVIWEDHYAMYMYASRVLGGRLPGNLHNRMVMESCLGVTPGIRRYFEYLREI